MSRNKEYVSPTGLRLDGRRPLEARKMHVRFGTVANCEGSCTVEVGSSKVCASVFGPRECASTLEGRHDEAILTCGVAVAAFAGLNRRNPQHRSKLYEEIAASVVQVARSVVLLSQFPNSQIRIFVEVLQQDGSEKVACINAACLALIDANVAMRDAVVCVNVGLVDNNTLVDLTSEELRSQCPVLSAAFTGHGDGDFIWVETTSRLSPESVEVLMQQAQRSAASLFDSDLQPVLREHAARVLKLQN